MKLLVHNLLEGRHLNDLVILARKRVSHCELQRHLCGFFRQYVEDLGNEAKETPRDVLPTLFRRVQDLRPRKSGPFCGSEPDSDLPPFTAKNKESAITDWRAWIIASAGSCPKVVPASNPLTSHKQVGHPSFLDSRAKKRNSKTGTWSLMKILTGFQRVLAQHSRMLNASF